LHGGWLGHSLLFSKHQSLLFQIVRQRDAKALLCVSRYETLYNEACFSKSLRPTRQSSTSHNNFERTARSDPHLQKPTPDSSSPSRRPEAASQELLGVHF